DGLVFRQISYVLLGIHMIFDGKPDRQWKEGEKRQSELVFIGRNLDEASLQENFKACVV
ncbi:MAG: GTP-binding protein, partial [Cyanobacteria bacterium J06639_18]